MHRWTKKMANDMCYSCSLAELSLCACDFMLKHLFIPLVKSKIWALQDGTTVIIGGKTNRAKAEFPEDMNRLLDKVPEIVGSPVSADVISG